MQQVAREPHADELNLISGEVVDAAIQVHSHLGPGLLESAYEACLAYELNSRRLKVVRQVALPVSYRGVLIDVAYRMDLVVNDALLVAVKAIDAIAPIHKAQVLSYLRLSGIKLGLI